MKSESRNRKLPEDRRISLAAAVSGSCPASVIGIIRVILIMDRTYVINLLILLFRLIRNLYYPILSIFLVDGLMIRSP